MSSSAAAGTRKAWRGHNSSLAKTTSALVHWARDSQRTALAEGSAYTQEVIMPRVDVTIAYGTPKIAAMVQALAREVGGPDTKCEVSAHRERDAAEFASEEQAEEFRSDVGQYLPALAYVSTPE